MVSITEREKKVREEFSHTHFDLKKKGKDKYVLMSGHLVAFIGSLRAVEKLAGNIKRKN